MYAQLGNIQFEVLKGFTGLTGSTESNLTEHALIEGKPKLQHVGNNLRSLELTVTFDSTFCTPQTELDTLKSSLELAEVLPLIMGNGVVVGQYVIKTVAETHTNEADDGTLLQAEVTISLIEYATGDPQASTQQAAISNGFANADNNPAEFIPEMQPIEPSAIACSNLVDIGSQMDGTSSVLGELTATSPSLRPTVNGIIQSMLQTGDSLNQTLGIINADSGSEVYNRTRPLAVSIDECSLVTNDVLTEAQNCLAQIDAGNVMGVSSSVGNLVLKANELKRRSASLSTNSAQLISLAVTE